MKFIVGACVLLQVALAAHCKVLPDYLADLPCKRSDPQYSKCSLQSFEKSRQYLAKGIPEIGLPGMDPYKQAITRVNRKLNDLININLTLTNSKTTGMMGMIIDKMNLDPKRLQGEVSLTIPESVMETEYNVLGQLFIIPLKSEGFFRGNFTNTKLVVRGSVKETYKNGVKHYKIDKMSVKLTTNGAYVKMVAKNPDEQFAADLIATFFNENPKRTLEAVNPIAIEAALKLYKEVIDGVLAKIPAEELLPE